MNNLLIVGLAGWIIDDGNYEHLVKGDRVCFALEINTPTTLSLVERTSAQEPLLEHIEANLYRVLGRVTHVFSDWWVIDAGFLFYRQRKPPEGVRVGCWIMGDIQVGVDPFDYVDGFSQRSGAPALIYDWRITKIEVQTAPYIEVSPRTRIRDPNKIGWREVEGTAITIQSPAEYILHCERIDSTPVRHSIT